MKLQLQQYGTEIEGSKGLYLLCLERVASGQQLKTRGHRGTSLDGRLSEGHEPDRR